MTAAELEIYLVGGAVRDTLLEREVTERDWVVVGASAEQLLAQGFKQVGKDFPVYLHPRSGEEYALARTERKSGHGYSGFTCNSDPTVTLEEDLSRRDLTVNAMAQDGDGNIIDPYGGQQDLAARVLRHVSAAFVEDPLRVLRVARFAARYQYLGFTIAEETLALMQSIAASGELQHLPVERVWQELERALVERSPQTFFTTLLACHAVQALTPDWQIEPQHLHYLQQAAASDATSTIRFATLVGTLPEPDLAALCSQLRPPNQHRELAELCCRFGKSITQDDPASTLQLLELTDAWRRPERFEEFLSACGICYQLSEVRAARLREGMRVCHKIDTSAWRAAGVPGKEIGAHIRAERLRLLTALDTQ